jgi:hypothetical protein
MLLCMEIVLQRRICVNAVSMPAMWFQVIVFAYVSAARCSHGRGHWFDPCTAQHKSIAYESQAARVGQKYGRTGRDLPRHLST